MTKKAIVIGCEETGLAVFEALASAGINILAIPNNRKQIGRYSRFIDEKTRVVDPRNEKDKLLKYLTDLESKWDGSLIIVSGDEGIEFIAENFDFLSERFVPAISDPFKIKTLLNKESLYKLAKEIGVPTPIFFIPDDVNQINKNKERLSYPCMIKPVERHKFTPIFKKKLLLVDCFDELLNYCKEMDKHGLTPIIMEIVPGDDDTLFHYRSYIDRNGEVLAELCTQKLRQDPPRFGIARVSKTIPIISELREETLKILNSISYQGVSSAEFKYDFRDSRYKLIEINARPTRPERLFHASGINFPLTTYLDRVEHTSSKTKNYEHDLYWISNFRDIYSFFRGKNTHHISVKEYFSPYFKKNVFCVPFKNDPLPFLAKLLYAVLPK